MLDTFRGVFAVLRFLYAARMYLKIGNIPRIIIARGKIFPYICCAFRGNDILKKEVPYFVKVANFITAYEAQVTRLLWVACLRMHRGLATPNKMRTAAHFLCIVTIPVGCKEQTDSQWNYFTVTRCPTIMASHPIRISVSLLLPLV